MHSLPTRLNTEHNHSAQNDDEMDNLNLVCQQRNGNGNGNRSGTLCSLPLARRGTEEQVVQMTTLRFGALKEGTSTIRVPYICV